MIRSLAGYGEGFFFVWNDVRRLGRLQVQITPRALPLPKRLEWGARA